MDRVSGRRRFGARYAITRPLWLPLFACPYVRSDNSELEASAVIPLPQLLERRSDELPLGPFDAQHRGHLVGDREPGELGEWMGGGTWLGSRICRWLVRS